MNHKGVLLIIYYYLQHMTSRRTWLEWTQKLTTAHIGRSHKAYCDKYNTNVNTLRVLYHVSYYHELNQLYVRTLLSSTMTRNKSLKHVYLAMPTLMHYNPYFKNKINLELSQLSTHLLYLQSTHKHIKNYEASQT